MSNTITMLVSGDRLDHPSTGGTIYEAYLAAHLEATQDFRVEYVAPGNASGISRLILTLINGFSASRSADVCLLDLRAMSVISRRKRTRYICLLHHLDIDNLPTKAHKLLWRSLAKRALYRADTLVTVSLYWQRYFQEIGAHDVRIIYNPFDVDRIEQTQIDDFMSRYRISPNKPIIYIGQNSPLKGTREVFEALKGEPYTIITTGQKATIEGPLHLDLPYDDYLKLLRASSLVVIMSSLAEGWCRVAHEAMILARPVIGSGKAGMRELLEGGQQIVHPTVSGLRDLVRGVMGNAEWRSQLGISGSAFARNFTFDRFARSWDLLLAEGKKP